MSPIRTMRKSTEVSGIKHQMIAVIYDHQIIAKRKHYHKDTGLQQQVWSITDPEAVTEIRGLFLEGSDDEAWNCINNKQGD